MTRKIGDCNTTTPMVEDGTLYTDDEYTGTRLDSPTWLDWLQSHTTFYYRHATTTFTCRKEQRRDRDYWYAYQRRDGRLVKAYIGSHTTLTTDRLQQIGHRLDKT